MSVTSEGLIPWYPFPSVVIGEVLSFMKKSQTLSGSDSFLYFVVGLPS